MCWFSAEHASKIEEAKAGQRLGIKNMNWHSKWVVRETELENPRPCPVCLIDGTKVMFRFSESQQALLPFGPEAEAAFRMLKRPRRDIFEFAGCKQITLGDLPGGVILDVLVVPGAEQVSAVLNMGPAEQDEEQTKKEPLFGRLLAHF